MKIFFYFYTLIIILTQIVWVIRSLGEIEDIELKYLSHKLSPIECLRLLEAVYPKKPMTDEDFAQTKVPFDDESLLRRQLERPLLSHENCKTKLEEWNHSLPEKSSGWARAAMETVLCTLGRPDLAQYVKRNRRIVRYLEDVTRISRNAAKHPTGHSAVSKTVQVTPVERKYKDPPKEAVVQFYRSPEVSKATKEKSNPREIKGAHIAGARRIEDNDSRTRWTAFLILLGLIALIILATVVFALYKKKRVNIFPNNEKSCDDRCPLADRFGRKPTIADVDVEQGTSTPCSPCGRRRKRGSTTQEPSRSPSSICLRDNSIPIRKPKRNKYTREKQQKLEKRRRRRCDKKCAGIMKKESVGVVERIDKSTKTWERKMSEKSQSTSACPTMPRLDLKKFHEKIANILRKDDTTCKCCKCSVYSGEDKCQGLKNLTKKDICSDDKCQKFKLRRIAELCLSPDEKLPKNNADVDSNRKKKGKNNKKKKNKKRAKDTDMDKESEKTSPENSPRSKDRRESKTREKKVKKRTCNVETACGRKTCHFGKPLKVERVLEVDNKI